MKRRRSLVVPTAPSSGAQKLGHPVRLSNLVSEENRGRSHPAQWYAPGPYSLSRALVPARSVPCSRSTRNCSGVSCARHSPSLLTISKLLPVVPLAISPSCPEATTGSGLDFLTSLSARGWTC